MVPTAIIVGGSETLVRGAAVVSVAREETAVVSVAGERAVTTAGGALDYVSFSNEGGVTGLMDFGLADQRPRYGHRGSGTRACCSAASSSAATPEGFG